MTVSSALTLIIQSFAVFSALLLAGTFLRARVRVFQNLYLPACVIGGFLGLILGPNVLNLIPFSEDIMSVASATPGVLIVPVLAAVPMCMNMGGKNALKGQKDAIILTLILCGVNFLQFLIGLSVNVVYGALGGNTYKTFGLELIMGFSGGHGMAGTLGNSLQSMGAPYWEVAQGIASTAATVGLIGGIIIGVYLINMAARRGYTTVVKSAGKISREYQVGYYEKGMERPSLGVQTTIPNSIETITFHMALLLLASGGGYVLSTWVSTLGIELLSAMSTWFYAMMLMAVFWVVIRMLRVDYLFDESVKNKVTGFLSDYLIVAAIMSIPVKLVFTYWVPIVIMFAIGFLVTPVTIYFVSKRFFRNAGLKSAWDRLAVSTEFM